MSKGEDTSDGRRMPNIELAKLVREQATSNKDMRKELDKLKGEMDKKKGDYNEEEEEGNDEDSIL